MENYNLYRLGIWLVAHLPRGFSYFVAGIIADLNFLFNSTSRRAVYANQQHVLPPSTGRWQRWRAARGAFRYFAFSVVDFFRIPRMRRDNLDDFVECTGWEHLEDAMANGKGGIFVTVHMGSWEMAGAYLGLRGVPLTVAALPHKDPRINDIFLGRRELTGMEVVPVGGAMRKLGNALPRGRFIALVVDRDTTGHGPTLPFFGTPTQMPDGHAQLALRTGASLVPGCIYRRADGRCVLDLRPPIIPDPAHDTVEDLAACSLRVMEEFIAAHPRQWSMFYPLWPAQANESSAGHARDVHPI